jgi:peptidoglycan/LPS O-acetylase OafA/YrhL
MKSVGFRRANELKSVLIVGLIATGWWLQNYHIQYFWASGERYLPIGGGAIVALMITAVALGIKIPEGDEAKREYGILKYLMSFLEKLGFYCYGIYIWHAVLAMLNGKIWQFPPGVDRLMILLVALLLAPLSYKFIEKPFLRLKINA